MTVVPPLTWTAEERIAAAVDILVHANARYTTIRDKEQLIQSALTVLLFSEEFLNHNHVQIARDRRQEA
jgi:hypothetical protein